MSRCPGESFATPANAASGSGTYPRLRNADAALVQPARKTRQRDERAELRAERDTVSRQPIAQGFDAEAVPGEDQSIATRVPQRDREHPAQSGDAVRAHLLVEVDDGLRITPRPKAMPAGDQVAPQVMVIVDLPIEDDLNGAILVGDRLLPAGDVDDRQPAHAERHLGGDEVAAVVRAAVDNRVAHRAHGAAGLLVPELPSREAGDAAHRAT